MKRLIVSEKPSVGQAIAAALGVKGRGDGYIENSDTIISWCVGHLLGLAAPDAYDEKYGKWRYEDLPILPGAWRHTAAKDKRRQLETLIGLMKRADVTSIVNACDAGREGELIFRLVYAQSGCKKPVSRLWISSMEDAAIREGFQNLRPGADYDGLYAAALCREKADWLVGLNATRLFSVLYRQTLNVGRVQSPTLAMLAAREQDIAAFVKEPFYTPEMDLGGFTASGEKLKSKTEAEAVRAACDGKTAVVQTVQREKKSAAPPKLYDLTTLQRKSNRLFGFTAQQTLDHVQALYEKKLCTYPRTDSRFLTEDMAAGLPVLINQAALIVPGIRGKAAVTCDAKQVIDNGKVTDHHAIIPTMEMRNADLAALPSGERDILFLLAVRLVCAVGEKHLYAETVVALECEGVPFRAKGKTVLSDGWKAAEQAYKAARKGAASPENDEDSEDGQTDTSLPELAEGQAFENASVSIKEGHTSPPKHFSEDTLLSAMECAGADDMPEDAERKGLGTPATRAAIIEKLVKSGLIARNKKQLLPTGKGVNLIAVLPETVKSPMLTAEWEHRLKQIERGELAADAFMEGIAAFTAELVAQNCAPDPAYLSLFAQPVSPKGEAVGICPRCGGSIREGGRGFFCDDRSCGFKLWKDNRFFVSKKKALSKAIVAALLKDGRVAMIGLYSEKTGKTYDATVLMEPGEKGSKYVNFKLDFPNNKGGRRG